MHDHSSDHDLLIELNGKCDTIISQMKAINGRVGKSEDEIVCMRLEREKLLGVYEHRVATLESRPSARRTVILMGAVVVVIQGLIAFGKSLFGG